MSEYKSPGRKPHVPMESDGDRLRKRLAELEERARVLQVKDDAEIRGKPGYMRLDLGGGERRWLPEDFEGEIRTYPGTEEMGGMSVGKPTAPKGMVYEDELTKMELIKRLLGL